MGKPEVVIAGWPSAETIVQSNRFSPAMRLAARNGSMAEATHMIEAPEKTRKVSFSGERSARKIEEVSLFIKQNS